MRISLRALFHLAAIAFFIMVLVFEENAFELLALGLACIAAGQLSTDLAADEARERDPAA